MNHCMILHCRHQSHRTELGHDHPSLVTPEGLGALSTLCVPNFRRCVQRSSYDCETVMRKCGIQNLMHVPFQYLHTTASAHFPNSCSPISSSTANHFIIRRKNNISNLAIMPSENLCTLAIFAVPNTRIAIIACRGYQRSVFREYC